MDLLGLQRQATGALGWLPETFRSSTLYDLTLALEGLAERDDTMMTALATHAAWVVNHVRPAIWAKSWRQIEAKQLYHVDRHRPPLDTKAAREEMLNLFPPTLPITNRE